MDRPETRNHALVACPVPLDPTTTLAPARRDIYPMAFAPQREVLLTSR